MTYISRERRIELCEAKVTLNGIPAKITGYKHDFALVSFLNNGLGCEFAWETVEHIVTNRDGKFAI